ncbi:hypothetical protein SDC9_33242 [bioreactor metagenome]|uniref:DUF5671 domain-containing protein n=1 Tax=bioreactor metagenome TaxID=1076179 RepID=A0A644V8X5_9ZZZZ|nr:DUF5671 domain-containing protein [Candidatus Elulimicrobiales bacterium]
MSEQVKKQSLSPKFFFLSLGVLVSLIVSVVSAISLFFETLKKVMPDVLNAAYYYGYDSYSYDKMRVMLATLIIAFPLYLILSYFWKKVVKKGVEGWNIVIFKWMIYLILFLAIVVFAVDLITLVNNFVSGELTARFLWKVLATALIAGLAWVYYYSILRDFKKEKNKKILFTSLFALAVILFLGSIFFGFKVMGSPATQRALRLDSRRVNDLQSVQWQVINYWQQKSVMPQKLEDLKDPLSYSTLPVDPEFEKGKTYEYNFKEGLTFELCADFSAPMPKGWVEDGGGKVMPMFADKMATSVAYPGSSNESWDHEAGKTCFERTIDPEIYKPYEK